MKRAEFAALHAFLLSQRGQADTFTTVLPGHTAPQGTWAGAPVVSGAGQSGASVALSGFTASQTGVAKAGDLLKFAGHSKVYMVTADANSSGTGTATLSIQPALIASPANGEALTTSSVPFTVALASDNLDANLSPGVIYGLEIDLVEAW
jgi:predicted urease superfamily metal-dependent hydrolase